MYNLYVCHTTKTIITIKKTKNNSFTSGVSSCGQGDSLMGWTESFACRRSRTDPWHQWIPAIILMYPQHCWVGPLPIPKNVSSCPKIIYPTLLPLVLISACHLHISFLSQLLSSYFIWMEWLISMWSIFTWIFT